MFRCDCMIDLLAKVSLCVHRRCRRNKLHRDNPLKHMASQGKAHAARCKIVGT